MVVNADLAAAETLLLPPDLCRSEYLERSGGSRNTAGGGAGGAAGGAGDEASGGGGFRSRGRGWGFSTSTVSFYFALNRRYDVLRHHNVFLAPAGEDAWGGLFDAATFGSWGAKPAGAASTATTGTDAENTSAANSGASFHFYLHAPTRTDPSAVDIESDDALMVLVPVPPLNEKLEGSELEAAEAACISVTLTPKTPPLLPPPSDTPP